jgi:hypothetical protein
MAQFTVTSWTAALLRAVGEFGGCFREERPVEDPLQLRARQQVWRLRRAYEKLVAGGDTSFIPLLLARSATLARDTAAGLIVWLEFLEDLIQEAEKLYGAGPGKGEFKSSQVKAAMLYAVSNSPSPLIAQLKRDPGLLTAITDWAIDSVVYILNSRELWTPGAASSADGFGSKSWLRGIAIRIAAFLNNILFPPPTLDPRLRSAVDRILATQGADPVNFLGQMLDIVSLLQQNRRQVVPLLELIASAASDAESFLELDGPAKRAYACDLVIAFLEQELAVNFSDAARIVVQSMVEFLLDSVVMIFNKRAFFSHRTNGATMP